MKGYTTNSIAALMGGTIIQSIGSSTIDYILHDSRKVIHAASSIFFALKGQHRNGHQFIEDLYGKDVRNFVISDAIDLSNFPEANFIQVHDTLNALQQLAAAHRSSFTEIPVIGITGSNGKTIVKDWLDQCLQDDFRVVKSPKSYNSQIGVPLSVWQMNAEHTLAIFEAGISTTGEMQFLEKVIQPTIGVFTNIGEAHSEGFDTIEQKAKEKALLFKNADSIIYCLDHSVVRHAIHELEFSKEKTYRHFTWSNITDEAFLFIDQVEKKNGTTTISAICNGHHVAIEIPFIDEASIENAITCWVVMLSLGVEHEMIREKMLRLLPVDMRLELKKGINHTVLINDSYSADINSLEIALDFLQQQKGGNHKTVILSDFLQSGLPDEKLYDQIASTLKHHRVNKVIGIGEMVSEFLPRYLNVETIKQHYFPSTNQFIQHFLFSDFKDDVILIKGARKYQFEKIVSLLEEKVHQTVLEINLNALTHNLNEYKKALKPGVRIMAMVKAFAYGSGGAEIAGKLQFNKVDYLGVAYTDEAVELRKSGITLPIMVMNPEESSFNAIVEYGLEPNIFSMGVLASFKEFIRQQGLSSYPIHIEVETGMNRLGFAQNEITDLSIVLNSDSYLHVQSLFTHLAASESKNLDDYSKKQFELFQEISKQLKSDLGYGFICHIANSAAIVRHPEMQMDMVRLGIGLYGIDNAQDQQLKLQVVATLRSTVAQLKHLKKGESVSYNRKSIVDRDSVIATVRIGYADGFLRSLGNGVGKMQIRGNMAPVIGSVCMDMTMIDVTDVPGVKEGDDVIIIGNDISVEDLADWAQTIPYEIMTGISQRVKRVYYEE